MRNNGTDAEPKCLLLVTNLDPAKPMSDRFVVGTSFFQNFDVMFEYANRLGTSNSMYIVVSDYTLPGSSIDQDVYAA